MDWKRVQKLIEAINTYYGFAVLVYVVVLYLASHHRLFLWVLLGITPLIAGWTGYLLKGFIQRRYQRFGFRIISDVMTYEIGEGGRYTLRYRTKLKATESHLTVYPIFYNWSGSGHEELPILGSPAQYLLSAIKKRDNGNGVKLVPYILTNTTENPWKYWFVAFNPPINTGETTVIDFSQDFVDKKGTAKPILYYTARVPMKRLELNVKFPANASPSKVYCNYIKPSDPSWPREGKGLEYDPVKQWATWAIDKPKKGYCYRIQWQ